MALSQEVNRRQGIFHFALPEVVATDTEPDSAKIETQHFATEAEERLCNGEDHLVVHRPLV